MDMVRLIATAIRLFSVVLLVKISHAGGINVFLNVSGETGAELVLDKVVFEGDGLKRILRGLVASRGKNFSQFFLGRVDTQGERFSKVVLFVKEVRIKGLSYPLCEKKVEIPLSLIVGREESISAFIEWNADVGWAKGCFYPRLSFHIQSDPVREELLLVACENTDTLFFVRTDSNRVEASFGVKKDPIDVAVNCDGTLGFVLSKGKRAVQVISFAPLRTTDLFSLPFVVVPKAMSVLGLGNLVVVDGKAGYILVVSSKTGEVLGNLRLSFGLEDVVADADKLAVSVPVEQRVYVFDNSLVRRAAFKVPGNPTALWLDGIYMYVTNITTGNVEVYKLTSGAHVASVFSGAEPMDIVDTGTKVYVSNRGENTVSVFDKNQYVRIRKISLDGTPCDMAFSHDKKWLYVSLPYAGKVAVVDTVRDRVEGYIDVGCKISSLEIRYTQRMGACW